MRIRATVAAATGALALSAFVVPAAHAADSGSSYRADVAKVLGAAHSGSGRAAFTATTADPAPIDVTFSGMKVNNGKAIAVGITNHVVVPVTYTLKHGADVDITSPDFQAGPFLYRGSVEEPSSFLFGDEPGSCTATSATSASCKAVIDIRPAEGDLLNSEAGSWKAAGLAIETSGQTIEGMAVQGGLGTVNVQRYSKLTVNAAPEPVTKGKTLTVTGKLSRANWETNKYAGYTGQSVQLQFRKKNSTTYTTVKTVKTDGTGNLKTTTKASVDGYYRYSFAGTSTTPAVKATGDYVDVR
ncbi:hypothetical protein [Streptomyces sp. NBC_01571]|uniref:hypothetical protein n=1 Tax=unclassified Streptomyces TaxID=2593676 RepID=UPI0022518D71|nr:hypothetical protein [Streptomyces sp. NBC_01571]MCX4575802.1 hypothetical protein [Streptomyces sp. NBC_01571]